MARQVLPVNFQDDVLNASMNGKRRYMLLQQDDGSYILNDVTSYDTEGSTFGAAQINATNQAVNQSVDKDDVLNTSEEVEANVDEKKVTGALVTKQLISEFQAWFGITEDGQRGWKEQGADTVIPFSRATKVLAMFHASTSGITRYTAEQKIFGLTMVTEDARESYTVLKVNGEDQPVKDIAQISSTYVSGYQTYDITLNPGDEVAVTNRGGNGSDIVLLSGIVQSANQ